MMKIKAMKAKHFVLSLFIAIAALLFIFNFHGCDSKPAEVGGQPDVSIIIDSIKRIETAKLKKHSDSLIAIHNKKDSIAGVKLAVMEKDYNRLRAIVRHLTSIKVDSLTQVVIVPVSEYNAFVESGNKCDSMQALKDTRILEKDSVNAELVEQLKQQEGQNKTTTQALTTERELTAEEKQKVIKLKKANKVLIKIIVIESAILAILAIVI